MILKNALFRCIAVLIFFMRRIPPALFKLQLGVFTMARSKRASLGNLCTYWLSVTPTFLWGRRRTTSENEMRRQTRNYKYTYSTPESSLFHLHRLCTTIWPWILATQLSNNKQHHHSDLTRTRKNNSIILNVLLFLLYYSLPELSKPQIEPSFYHSVQQEHFHPPDQDRWRLLTPFLPPFYPPSPTHIINYHSRV